MKEIFTIDEMLDFAKWAIHSGKCNQNPNISDIQEWIMDIKKEKQPFRGNLLPEDYQLDN